MAPIINVDPGGLIDIQVRNVLNNVNVEVDVLRNAEIIKNAIVVVDVL